MSDDAATPTPGEARPNAELGAEVQAWRTENWDPDRSVDEWWKVVAAAGWTAPHFTLEQGGRGLPRRVVRTVRAAFKSFGALRPPGGLGLLMAGPTILTHGTPEQIDRFVPSILDGQAAWCQLFSEPGAGSDLAGLTTRATRDGDKWVISGQKVWSSQAKGADYGMLLARTNFDVPKHQGISWFACKLDQPGVTVHPLREMTGDDIFNEIFLDGAFCDDGDLIGGQDNGWAVTQTTLHFERTGIGAGGIHAGFPEPGRRGGMLGRSAGAAALEEPEDEKLTLGYADVIELARSFDRTSDPMIRQQLALLYALSETGLWNAQRGKVEAKRGGGQAVASIGKLTQTRIVKLAAGLATQISGPHGLIWGPEGAAGGTVSKAMVFSAASSIYGGTDEIQHNIIAERTLGLPREPAPDRNRPFGEVLRDHAPADGSTGPA